MARTKQNGIGLLLERTATAVTRWTGSTSAFAFACGIIIVSQNKDSLAIHLKLNEIVAAVEGASNRLIDVESLTEHELTVLRRHYGKLAQMAKQDASLTNSHSIEEAEVRHKRKASLS